MLGKAWTIKTNSSQANVCTDAANLLRGEIIAVQVHVCHSWFCGTPPHITDNTVKQKRNLKPCDFCSQGCN